MRWRRADRTSVFAVGLLGQLVLFGPALALDPTPPACAVSDPTCSADSASDATGYAHGIADIEGDAGGTSSTSAIVGSSYTNDSAFDGGPGSAASTSALDDGTGTASGDASVTGLLSGSASSAATTDGTAYEGTGGFLGDTGSAAAAASAADALGGTSATSSVSGATSGSATASSSADGTTTGSGGGYLGDSGSTSSLSTMTTTLGTASGEAQVSGAGEGSAGSTSSVTDTAASNEGDYLGDDGSATSFSRYDDGTGFAEGEAGVAGAGPGSVTSTSSVSAGVYRNDATYDGEWGWSSSTSGLMTDQGLVSSYVATEGSVGSTYSETGIDGTGTPYTSTGATGDSGGSSAATSIESDIGGAYSEAAFYGASGSASSDSHSEDGALVTEGSSDVVDGGAYSLSAAEGPLGYVGGISAVDGGTGAAFSLGRVDAVSLLVETGAVVGLGNIVSISGLEIGDSFVVGTAWAEGSGGAETFSSTAADAESIVSLNYGTFSGDSGTVLSELRVGYVEGFAMIEANASGSSSFVEIDVFSESQGDIGSIDSVIDVNGDLARTYSSIGIGGVAAVGEFVVSGGSAAFATVILNQSLTGNTVTENAVDRRNLLDQSVQDGIGVFAINQASGNLNNQAIIQSYVIVDGPGVLGLQFDGKVELRDNSLVVVGPNAREDRITDSFVGTTGIVAVNQSAGSLNQEAAVLVFGFSTLPNLVPIGDIELATVKSNNTISADEASGPKSDIIDGTSFQNFSGIAQVTQAAGNANIINVVMAISVSGL